MEIDSSQDRLGRYLWRGSLACFILAGLTGFLYRLGMIGWLPEGAGLALENIRHAHSHLMFFGWAVPFPLYILTARIAARDADIDVAAMAWMKRAIAAGLVFGILSYPFFLLFGYRSVPLGEASLPLSVIFSGLVMVSWYLFMGGYLKVRSVLSGDRSRPWYDGSLMMLFICSLGAWGVAVVQALDPANQLLMKGLTHFFLATFTEGWVVLVILAIVVGELDIRAKDWKASEEWPLGCIAIGAPLTFPLGISESLLTPVMLAGARAGGFLVAAGLLWVLYTLIASGKWRGADRIWKWTLFLLGLKAAIQLAASVLPSSFWLSDHALRVFYLHILLLGGFTLAVFTWTQLRTSIGRMYFQGIVVSVILVLFSLLMLTRFWPVAWGGMWMFYVLAAAALLPSLAVLAYWLRMSINAKKTDSIPG